MATRHERRPAGRLTPDLLPGSRRCHHPSYEKLSSQGWKAIEAEGKLSEEGWRKEQQWALDMGLPGAESLTDRSIPTFARGELPHFAGINTFLKAPYVENVRDVGEVRRRRARHPVRQRHHLPAGHPLRAAGDPADLRALHALQLRAGRRPARADDAVRRRRRVHHPGQPREELRPDHPRGGARRLQRGPAADAGRRPLDRLSLRARHRPVHLEEDRHHPFRPPHRHPGEGPGRADAHHALVLGDQPAQRQPEEPGPGRHRRLAGAALRGGRGEEAPDQRADHRRHGAARASRRPPRSRSSSPGTAPTRSISASTSTASTAASCPAPAGPSRAASCRARR